MKPPAIDPKELERLRNETELAQIRFVERKLGFRRKLKALTAGNGPVGALDAHMQRWERRMLCDLRTGISRDLSEPEHVRIITHAAKANDLDFFKQLGRVLESKPPKRPSVVFTKLELFLFDHWAVEKDGLPPLAILQDEAVWNIVDEFLGGKGMSAPRMAGKGKGKLGLPRYKGRRRSGIMLFGKFKFSD